jgi:hypothetical protein
MSSRLSLAESYNEPEALILIEGIEHSGMVVDIEPFFDREKECFAHFMSLVLPEIEFGQHLRSTSEEQYQLWKEMPELFALGTRALPLQPEHKSVLLWDHLLPDARSQGAVTLFLSVDKALKATLRQSTLHRQQRGRRPR